MKAYVDLEAKTKILKNLLSNKDYKLAKQVAEDEIELPDELYDVLYPIMYMDMPYGTAKARTGDPYQWIANNLPTYIKESEEISKATSKKATPYDFGYVAYKKGLMCASSRDKDFFAWVKANERQNVEDIKANLPHFPSSAAQNGWLNGWNAAEAESN